tara:strand:+ start:1653 stop:2039 length:387 start_codon:yes stop_codon:yes gene_type:complete
MFEVDQQLPKKKWAIDLYLNTRGGDKYQKLGHNDVDFRIKDENNNAISYVEVKVLDNPLSSAYPLTVEARKIIKLRDKRIKGVIIWACIDAIIYSSIEELKGETFWDKATGELTLSFSNKRNFKYVRA